MKPSRKKGNKRRQREARIKERDGLIKPEGRKLGLFRVLKVSNQNAP